MLCCLRMGAAKACKQQVLTRACDLQAMGGPTSVMWNRQFGAERLTMTQRWAACSELEGTLRALGAAQLVVGHTPQVRACACTPYLVFHTRSGDVASAAFWQWTIESSASRLSLQCLLHWRCTIWEQRQLHACACVLALTQLAAVEAMAEQTLVEKPTK
jgi:hypothetical protein